MGLFGRGKKKDTGSNEPALPTINDAVIHDSKQPAVNDAAVQQDSVQEQISAPLQDQAQTQESMQNPLLGGQNNDNVPSEDEASFEEQFNSLLDGSDNKHPDNSPHPLDSSVQEGHPAVQPQDTASQQAQPQTDTNVQQSVNTNAGQSQEESQKDSFMSELGGDLPDVMEAPKNKYVNVKVKGDVSLEGTQYAPQEQQPDYSDLKKQAVPEPQVQEQPFEAQKEPEQSVEEIRKPVFIKRVINGKPELFTEIHDLKSVYDSFRVIDKTNASILQSLRALDRMHEVEESTIDHFKNYFEELQQDLKAIDHMLFEDFEGEN